jgi:hypothetical protein
VFAAAELTQARALIVIDPAGPSTTPQRVRELVEPVARAEVEFLAPRFRRHPRDGTLITQLVRPLIRAVYGVGMDEPLGAEFACSRRFAAHCLDQRIWDQDAVRFAIDLWLRTEAVANGFAIGQIWRPSTTAAASTTLRQAVRQILLALVASFRAHESFWRARTAVAELRTTGVEPDGALEAPSWDYETLASQARHDLMEIAPLLEKVLDETLLTRVLHDSSNADLEDELWVRIVYAFAAAAHRGPVGLEQLADMFVPLYLWRAAAFMSVTANESLQAVQARLDALCDAFWRLKSVLVHDWKAEM